MTSGYQAVLDACVLVNAALRDTLLRLAEPPHLYLPRWSHDIISETKRTLENKRNWSPQRTEYLISELHTHFEDAWVEGYEALIPAMGNHPKDRHVLAAAVKTGAQTIVTFNLKDFQKEALAHWDVQAQSPDAFLIDQFHLDKNVVAAKLKEQAADTDKSLEQLFSTHEKTVPGFVWAVRSYLAEEAASEAALALVSRIRESQH